jgi:hypothetical protein
MLDAFDYLEAQQAGLSKRLATLVRVAMLEILSHPHRQPKVFADFRRNRVDPFDYAIVYSVEADGVVHIAAFFHLRRNPAGLRRRLGG